MQTNPDGYYNIEMIDMMNCQYLSFVKEEKPIKHNASEKEEITREMKKRNYHQIRTRKGDIHKIGKKSEEHHKEEKENTGSGEDDTIEEDEGKKKTRINEKKKEKNKRTNKENMIKGMSEEEKMKEEKEIQYSNTPIYQEIKIYNIIKEGYQRIKKGEIIEGKEYQEETKKSGWSVGSDLTIISMIKKYGISDKKEIHNNPIIKYQLEENNGIRNEEYCQKVISERIKYLVELITININDKSFHTIPH
ncbi:hypothetical protein CL6EHI_105470 [Entamoeba histolytica]|uniref:Uncharacterized protein n=2 Tax=Entamoeba histolytica TaxID=5759 RepID=C4MBA8_ENTH1|nr:hypothetical protein EHI_105470 [Entamoeba histolytica HM-1:IMSS]EAL42742.1 hypothetical protein EHI_105470 [Entamoeba histolytica HM-1:IMSS]GAT99234.1 hypothetical protein CL6EHI_105470 [Entamoeba histolytica]|eukprot:XP_648128.1 hypothetical protein EHI_105470 [Entamoeba histolytica HM-1:IMSS]